MRPASVSYLTTLVAALAFTASAASAFERSDYTAEGFKAAQSAGKSIVIDVFAPWCPTCKAQQSAFDDLESKPEYAKVVLMKVDFDTQKDVVRAFKAQSQSTLIAFKGAKETGRSAGETDPAKLEALITSTVN